MPDRQPATSDPAATPAREGVGRRARRLLDRVLAGPPPAPDPGDALAATGDAAVRRVETAIGSWAPEGRGAAAAAEALGAALAGRRATAFLDGAALDGARGTLAEAARGGVPLVAHVRLDDPAGESAWQALAGTGVVQLHAGDVQEAADLAVVARLLAESALVPVALAQDGRETAASLQDLHLPDAGRLRALVGDAGDVVATATAAQRLLAGERRRRVPRSLAGDAPAAVGPRPGGRAAAAAAAAGAFGQAFVPRLFAAACSRLAAATGRQLAPVAPPARSRADLLLVATGAARKLAAAVTAAARAGGGPHVEVAGLVLVSPAPSAALVEALGRHRRLAVLDRATGSDEEGASARLVQRAVAAATVAAERPQVAALRLPPAGAPLAAADLVAACRSLAASWQPRLTLGVDAGGAAADERYPKRRARVDAWRAEHPRLLGESVAAGGTVPRTCAAEGVVAGIAAGTAGGEAAAVAGALLHATGGGRVAVRGAAEAEAVELLAWVRGAGPLGVPADDARVDLLVTLGAPTAAAAARLAPGATVVAVASPGASAEGLAAGLAAALPASGIDVLSLAGPAGDSHAETVERLAGATLAALARSGSTGATVRRLVAARRDGLADVPAAERERRLAAFTAALSGLAPLPAPAHPPGAEAAGGNGAAAARTALAPSTASPPLAAAPPAVAALWDQVGVACVEADGSFAPDPLLAAPVPAGSALLRPAAAATALPVLDASRCTGCGACWTLCPEGAWTAVPATPRALLEQGLELVRAQGGVADALRPLLGRLADAVAQAASSGGTAGAVLDVAFATVEAAGLPAGREDAVREAMAAVRAALAPLPLARTAAFWDRKPGGKPSLLVLALDAARCTGCGLCAAECAPGALSMASAANAPSFLAELQVAQAAAAALPAPSPALLDGLRGDPDVGPLAADLLTPAARAVVQGRGDAADAGTRLGLRLALAAGAAALATRRAAVAAEVAELRDGLLAAVRERLAAALPAADLGALGDALARAERPDAALATLLGELHDGAGDLVAVPELRRLVAAADALDPVAAALAAPAPAGLFTLVLGPGVRSAASFPWNPFAVPVACPAGADPLAVARGIAAACADEAAAAAAALRRARRVLERPGEAGAPDAAAEAPLGWSDLTDGERALCPPVVLAVDDDTARAALGGISEALAADLPLVVVALAGTPTGAAAVDLVALLGALPAPFLAQTSIGAPGHLASAAAAAMLAGRPALVRLHAPEPCREGGALATVAATARAALAGGFALVHRGTADAGAAAEAPPAPAAVSAREQELGEEVARLVAERDALAGQLAGAPAALREALRVELAREAKGRLLALLATGRPTPPETVQ